MSTVGDMTDDDPLSDSVTTMTTMVSRLAQRVEEIEEEREKEKQEEAAKHQGVQPLYPTLDLWMEHEFPKFSERRVSNTVRWCASWWDHPEARERLTSLWQSWEHLRNHPPLGMGDWFRDHLDPQLSALMNPDGPFAGCSPQRHVKPRPLPVDPIPAGYHTA